LIWPRGHPPFTRGQAIGTPCLLLHCGDLPKLRFGRANASWLLAACPSLVQFYIGCSACPDSKAFAETRLHLNEMMMGADVV
jgi:hypothetical protein